MDVVIEQDKKNERDMLKFVRANFAGFNDLKFIQNPEEMAVFDFNIYKITGKTEVKCRDIASTDYGYYFISKAKGDEVKQNPGLDYYIIYCFTRDKVIRVYHLNKIDLPEKEIDYMHRRLKVRMKRTVCVVNADDFIAEYQLPDNTDTKQILDK